MIYTDAHRFFLRVMMNEGVMLEDDAEKIIHRHSAGADLSLADVVKSVNAQIRPLQQSLKRTTNEVTGARELVLVWRGGGAAARAGALPPAELGYWRRLLETLAAAQGRRLAGIAALNLLNGEMSRDLSKSRAQELLDSWVSSHYLQRLEAGGYALGPRGLHEFEPYLREHMPDALDDCCLCQQAVFQGRSCPSCGDTLHSACMQRYLLKVKAWPCCKQPYNFRHSSSQDSSAASQAAAPSQDVSMSPASSDSNPGSSQLTRGTKRSRH